MIANSVGSKTCSFIICEKEWPLGVNLFAEVERKTRENEMSECEEFSCTK